MNSVSIETLLKTRGAWCKSRHGDAGKAARHEHISKLIAEDYVNFEHLREMLFHLSQATARAEIDAIYAHPEMARLLRAMEQAGLITQGPDDAPHVTKDARRYLSGGWLEELAYVAALEAGADEALFSQVVGWEVQGYAGENEIDLLMRKGNHLTFVSCKALKSHLDIEDRKHRNKLMEAVHEADNLADHFGRHGEKVALIVTTDLFDEVRKVPRYQALMGKAAVLDVHVIPLEELHQDHLTPTLRDLMGARHVEG